MIAGGASNTVENAQAQSVARLSLFLSLSLSLSYCLAIKSACFVPRHLPLCFRFVVRISRLSGHVASDRLHVWIELELEIGPTIVHPR